MAGVEIGKGCLQGLHGGVKDALHDAALLVGEERREREAALSEVVIHQPNDFGEVACVHGVFDFLCQQAQRFLLALFDVLHRSGHILIAEMEQAIGGFHSSVSTEQMRTRPSRNWPRP